MKQLFVTDLDHTFLNDNKKVTEFSKRVWNKLAEDKILTVATARTFEKTQQFLKELSLKAPLILLDGAMIVTMEKRIIDLNLLSKKVTDEIIKKGQRFGIEPFIISLKNYSSLEESFAVPPIMNGYQKSLIERSYKNDTHISYKTKIEGTDETLKVVYIGDEDILTPFSELLKRDMEEELEIKLSPEKYTGSWILTLLHPLSDKANGLKKITEYLNIPLSQTTVFGDSLNDIGMFQIARTSVAVKNALDEVKKEASIVLPYTNNDDGVAQYLQKFIL